MSAPQYNKKLYTLPSIEHMEKTRTNRGNYQDMQDLGIWVPENCSQLLVKQTNPHFRETLQIRLYNDALEHEKMTFYVKPDDDWVPIFNEYDSVPLVSTVFDCCEQPVLQLEYDCAIIPDLLLFKKGDDEGEFMRCWQAMNAPFVLLKGKRVQLLVPMKDRDFLGNLSQNSNVQSIAELLDFYEAAITRYDQLLGLSDDPSAPPVHRNVPTRYLLKADVNSKSLAYYCREYVAGNQGSVTLFLSKGWGPLHELGHGYDGDFVTDQSEDMPLCEVWNNIYAHSFEVTYNPANGWLFGQDRRKLERSVYVKRIGGKRYNEMDKREKLYMHIILKEHTGDQAMIHFNRKYREWKNRVQDIKLRTTDLLAEHWSVGGQFDVIPYYERYGLVVSDECKESVQNHNLESGCILRDLVADDDIAEDIRIATNLKSIYSIIRTRHMRDKGFRGRLIVKVAIENLRQIKGKSLYIMDGESIIREASVGKAALVFDEVNAGVYLIRGPYAATKPYHANSQRVVVSQNCDATVELNYVKVASPFVKQRQILFLGLGDDLFAEVTIYGVEGKLGVTFNGKEPHDRYPNKLYASIEIVDGPDVIYLKEFEGTTTGAFSETVLLSEGCKIRIYHAEPDRLRFYNPVLRQYDGELATQDKSSTYVMTQYGLMLESWTEAHRMELYATKLKEFLNFMQGKIGDVVDETCFAAERNQVHAAILVLPKPMASKYLAKYQGLILRKAKSTQQIDRSLKKI